MRKGVAGEVKFSGTLNQGQPTVGYRFGTSENFLGTSEPLSTLLHSEI
jgi:hypothetical protein